MTGIASPDRRAGRLQLALLLATACMPVLAIALISPVLAEAAKEFAGQPAADFLVPSILTAPALTLVLLAPVSGMLADRVDRRWALVLALGCYCLVGTVPLWADSLVVILISRVLLGITEAVIVTCATSLISDYWSGARRARYIGLQVMVGVAASVVFLIVGGVLGSADWRTPFWLYALAAPLAVAAVFVLWQPARAVRVSPAAGRVPWRRVIAPYLFALYGGIAFHALFVEMSFVLVGLGVTSSAVIGGVTSIMAAAAGVAAAAFGRLSALSPRVLLTAQLVGAAVGFGIVGVAHDVITVTIGGAIAGFANGSIFPTVLTWTANQLRSTQRGRGTGIWYAFWNSGQFITPLIITAFATALGGLQTALLLLGVSAAVAAVVAALTLRGSRESVRTQVVEDEAAAFEPVH